MSERRKGAVLAEHLGFSYGGPEGDAVLSDVSLDVAQGEFCAILGPNGSGKSTLMRLLGGLEKPVTGHVEFFGKPLASYSRNERARRIAYVPQTVSVDFSIAVRDLVMWGRSPHQGLWGAGSSVDREIVDEAMAFTSVSTLAARDARTLSGGERQRVFIAAAIAQEPSLLLLDEPTSALDPAHQIRVMDLLTRLKTERNMAVVTVLHDINLAAMAADRAVVLKRGRVAAIGPVSDALSRNILENVYECGFHEDRHPCIDVPRFTPVPGKNPMSN